MSGCPWGWDGWAADCDVVFAGRSVEAVVDAVVDAVGVEEPVEVAVRFGYR